jgi:hypothetical protein
MNVIAMFTCQINVISFEQRETSKCDTHEIPQGAECGNTRLLAALHDLRITVVVRGDEDNCQDTRQPPARRM